jgi:hypothetical protein
MAEELRQAIIALGLSLFAAFGACVKWINTESPNNLRIFKLVAEIISAMFVGFIMYFIYKSTDFFNLYVMFAFTGLIGYKGKAGVEFLFRFMVRTALKQNDMQIDVENNDK